MISHFLVQKKKNANDFSNAFQNAWQNLGLLHLYKHDIPNISKLQVALHFSTRSTWYARWGDDDGAQNQSRLAAPSKRRCTSAAKKVANSPTFSPSATRSDNKPHYHHTTTGTNFPLYVFVWSLLGYRSHKYFVDILNGICTL